MKPLQIALLTARAEEGSSRREFYLITEMVNEWLRINQDVEVTDVKLVPADDGRLASVITYQPQIAEDGSFCEVRHLSDGFMQAQFEKVRDIR